MTRAFLHLLSLVLLVLLGHASLTSAQQRTSRRPNRIGTTRSTAETLPRTGTSVRPVEKPTTPPATPPAGDRTGLQLGQCLPENEPCGGGGGGGTPGISVTPDGANYGSIPVGTGYTATFYVTNTGTLSGSTNGSCTNTAYVQCTAASLNGVPGYLNDSWSTNPGQVDTLVVTFDALLPGSATLSFAGEFEPGTVTNAGSYNLTITGAYPKAGAALVNYSADNWDRGDCLTFGAGEEGAWQCGDLVMSHSTLAYPTLNKPRAVTMVYNSATAAPRPTVAVNVTLHPVLTPSALKAELRVNGVLRDSASYTPWSSGSLTRQVVLSYDAAADPTGVYPYTMTIRATYPTGTVDSVISGQLVVVNRTGSVYGRGWAPAGVEQIYVGLTGNKILWVAGDGSSALYSPIATDVWAAPLGAYQDTLKRFPGPQCQGCYLDTYVRYLQHGVQVTYDQGGHHIATLNRLGHTTQFFWNTAGTRVDSLIVPPAGQSLTRYRFTYDANGKLDYITEPGTRILQVTVASGLLTGFVDPDNLGPTFGYDAAGRMTLRTNPQGATTLFAYAKGVRVTSVTIPVGRIVTDTMTSRTVMDPWDEKGLHFGTGIQTAADTATVYTKLFGPRPSVADDATFWVGRFGAPVAVRDPAGATTRYARADASHPQVVTRIDFPRVSDGSPTGRIVQMQYNTRANLLRMEDNSSHLGLDSTPMAVSRWTYGSANAPDSPDSIINPVGLVTTTVYGTNGLPSLVTAPGGHQTQFDYRTGSLAGLVARITELSVPVWDSATKAKVTTSLVVGVGYNALGNTVGDTTPTGYSRSMTLDPQQRVTASYDVAGYKTEYQYNSLDQVTATLFRADQAGLTGFPADSGVVAPFTTTNTYLNRRLITVLDPRSVRRDFGYDLAGAQITETDEMNKTSTIWMNRGGLVDSVRQRTGHTTKYTYDVAGRVVTQYWPARDLSVANTLTYTYDLLGRETQIASNPNAGGLTRSYYANGLVRSEFQRNADSMNYRYDAAARRTYLAVGNRGVATTHDDIYYRYDAASGDMTRVMVDWRQYSAGTPVDRDSVFLAYDPLGRRDQVTYTNGLVVTYAYDREGATRLVCGLHAGTPPGGVDALDFTFYNVWVDRRGQSRFSTTWGGAGGVNSVAGCGNNSGDIHDFTSTFDARGQMLSQQTDTRVEKYRYDASGNRSLFRRQEGSAWYQDLFSFPAGSNRISGLTRTRSGNLPYSMEQPQINSTTYNYDSAGSRVSERVVCRPSNACAPSGTPDLGWRDYKYDGLGRTVATNEWVNVAGSTWQKTNPASPQCQYDAAGRMFGPCENGSAPLTFDGQNVVRTWGASNISLGMSIVHGPGIDDPILGLIPYYGYRYVWVTGGNGRQYVTANVSGSPIDPAYNEGLQWDNNGGKYAGGNTHSNSFSSTRQPSAAMLNLSAFRNRFYDQQTGRWTQEDPLGLTGGINLYQFNGNNPASFNDPFGLCQDLSQDGEDPIGPEGNCRKLTPEEIQGLGTMCRDIDCSEIEIYDGKGTPEENKERERWLMNSGGVSITIGHKIYVADGDLAPNGDVRGDILAHEATHVGQYEDWWALRYYLQAITTQAYNKVMNRVDPANWNTAYQVPLPMDRNWADYGMEQQATIVETCQRQGGASAYCANSPYSFPRQ